jgi:hypothetical protein
LYTDKDCLDRPVIRCLHCSYCRLKNYFGPIRLEAQDPIVETVENSPGVEVDPAREPISQVAKNSPGVEWVDTEPPDPNDYEFREEYVERYKEWAAAVIEVESTDDLGSISQLVEVSPGVEVDQSPECVECFGDGYFEDESGLIKFCQCSSKPKLSRKMTQGAIVPASKKLPGSRSKTTARQLLELFKS